MALNEKFQHLKIELKAIKKATNSFSSKNLIGSGGFGKVYKGELVHTMVAIKILDRQYGQGDPEFWKEIMMLSHYRHPNVASLLGFCDQGKDKYLVYEYASRSSLDRYIHSDVITWIQRLKICIGAARGLAYLHNPDGSKQRVLHRDIKSSNILLDDNWKAMISDFGLSKIGPANQENTFLVSQVVGTNGYIDPNYIHMGLLTKESDVYSFGVVLFEVFCGRFCAGNNDSCSLIRQARGHYEQNKMMDIIHGSIKGEINPDSMSVFTTIAYQCLNEDYEQRPFMTEVVADLEIALQLQENKEVIIKGELLSLKPQRLQFPFELMKEISTSIQLKNRTCSHVAYKVKSTRPNTYAALPHAGILLPRSTCKIKFTMQPQKDDPDHDMRRNDKFMVQSAVVTPGFTPIDITRDLFSKESGNQVGECRLDVSFVAPKEPLLRLIEEGPKDDVLLTTSRSAAGTENLRNSSTSKSDAGTENLSKSTTVSGENLFNNHTQENSKGASMGGLLSIDPHELQFPFELMKEVSISLQLKNKTNSHVAFKVKLRNQIITMQAQKETPQDLECNDKYLLQSAVVSPELLRQNITRELFIEESGNQVEACILNVKYVAPYQPLSSGREAQKPKVLSKSANLRHIHYNENDFHSF